MNIFMILYIKVRLEDPEATVTLNPLLFNHLYYSFYIIKVYLYAYDNSGSPGSSGPTGPQGPPGIKNSLVTNQ